MDAFAMSIMRLVLPDPLLPKMIWIMVNPSFCSFFHYNPTGRILLVPIFCGGRGFHGGQHGNILFFSAVAIDFHGKLWYKWKIDQYIQSGGVLCVHAAEGGIPC